MQQSLPAASVAVTGAGGQLGSELCRRLGERAVPLDTPDFDLNQEARVREQLRRNRPRVVINTAAYTLVDPAEHDRATAQHLNADAVGWLAELCSELDALLVQISTDYVYDGAEPLGRPFRESDPPRAIGVYAQTKLAGEEQTARAPRHLIVRTCGLYGTPGVRTSRPNFVLTLLRLSVSRDTLRVVSDQRCTPSYVPHVADAVLKLIDHEATGLYHVTNRGDATWFEVAQALFELAGKEIRLEPITTAEWGAPAPRPAYSVLDTGKYQSLGFPPLPHWREALAEYLATGPASGM